MRILVTGGSGFIGSNFVVKSILSNGDEVTNVDKMTYASNPFYLKEVQERKEYKFIRDDINNISAHSGELRDIDTIVNFAAESHVDNSIKNAEEFIKSNVMGTFKLLEFARTHDLRFHQISTDEVYGTLPDNSAEKFTLESRYNPKNPYSASKASADFLVRSFQNTYDLRTTISNCSNNYGPHQHREKLIPNSIFSILNGKKVSVYGDGNQVRDWIHVEDHCDAVRTLLEGGVIGQTYLIGSNGERSNLEVVREILKLMNRGEELIEYVTDRPGHDRHYAIDPSSIMSLGWRPHHDFSSGLKDTVEHYLKYGKKYGF